MTPLKPAASESSCILRAIKLIAHWFKKLRLDPESAQSRAIFWLHYLGVYVFVGHKLFQALGTGDWNHVFYVTLEYALLGLLYCSVAMFAPLELLILVLGYLVASPWMG